MLDEKRIKEAEEFLKSVGFCKETLDEIVTNIRTKAFSSSIDEEFLCYALNHKEKVKRFADGYDLSVPAHAENLVMFMTTD